MALCATCGNVDDHTPDCPAGPPRGRDRTAAVQQAMDEGAADSAAAQELAAAAPRTAVLRLLRAERRLERQPSHVLTSYDAKRAYNALASKLKAERQAIEDQLESGEGARLGDELTFGRRVVEAAFALHLRRTEAAALDASSLSKLKVEVVELPPPGEVARLSTAIEQRLEASRDLDAKVSAWGWKNLRPLVGARDPIEVPPDLAGGGVSSYLGALLGRGPATRRVYAVSQFRVLGDRFRERLYLLGAHSIVQRVASRLAQAEEVWKRALKDDGAARWEDVQRQRDLIAFLLGTEAPEDVTGWIAAKAAASPLIVRRELRDVETIEPDEWDVLAKAYFLVYASIMAGQSSRDVGLESIAQAVIERRGGRPPLDARATAELLQSVRDDWHRKPPRELDKA